MIKAVIFDFDGVITDSKKAHYESFVVIFRQLGISFSQKEFNKLFGFPGLEIIRLVFQKHGIKENPETWLNRKNKIYFENIKKIRFNAGVVKLIKKLSGKYKLAVASNEKKEHIIYLLDQYKIRKHFTIILSAYSMKKKKPHPDIYIKASRKLRLKKKNCLVIEDSPFGVEAAKRAGMHCIGILTTNPKKNLKAADFILKDLRNSSRVVSVIKSVK